MVAQQQQQQREVQGTLLGISSRLDTSSGMAFVHHPGRGGIFPRFSLPSCVMLGPFASWLAQQQCEFYWSSCLWGSMDADRLGHRSPRTTLQVSGE